MFNILRKLGVTSRPAAAAATAAAARRTESPASRVHTDTPRG
jgi:hypothetical protein